MEENIEHQSTNKQIIVSCYLVYKSPRLISFITKLAKKRADRSTLLFFSLRFSLKNLRKTESPWEIWCKRIVASFSPVTTIVATIVIVVLVTAVAIAWSSLYMKSGRMRNWRTRARARTLSLYRLLSSISGCVTIHFPTGAVQCSHHPTFLSYCLSLLAASPRLWTVRLYYTIKSSSPLTLTYTSFSFDYPQLFNAQ